MEIIQKSCVKNSEIDFQNSRRKKRSCLRILWTLSVWIITRLDLFLIWKIAPIKVISIKLRKWQELVMVATSFSSIIIIFPLNYLTSSTVCLFLVEWEGGELIGEKVISHFYRLSHAHIHSILSGFLYSRNQKVKTSVAYVFQVKLWQNQCFAIL